MGKNTELRLERGEALGRKTVLLSKLLQRYLTSVSPLKKGHKQEVSRLNAWLKHPLASRDAASIKPAEIALYRDQQIKVGKANASIRIELSLFSALYKCPKHAWGYTLCPTRLPTLSDPQHRGRDRRLEEGELDTLLAATKDTTLS